MNKTVFVACEVRNEWRVLKNLIKLNYMNKSYKDITFWPMIYKGEGKSLGC